ncbi:MAG: CRTAC1 family protein, partial [Planctomycetota bacterium]
FGLGIVTVDLEGDGDTDLYVTNDSTPNHLWINQGDGTFKERGMAFGVALDDNGKEQAGMGIAVGDVTGDGRPDLFATNFSGENNSLYRSRFKRGRLSFDENSRRMGLGGPSTTDLGWGTGFIDVDHDRDLDVFVFNGHVYPQADTAGTDTSYAQPARLYRQGDGARFTVEDLAADGDLVQRAAVHGDLDGDGDLDLVALEMDGAVQLYENRASAGHWLIVELSGTDSNSHGLGAAVAVEVGDTALAGELRTAGGYQASLPPAVHFGLGDAESVTVEVRWPSGRVQRVEGVSVDQRLRLDESEAQAAPAEGEGGE